MSGSQGGDEFECRHKQGHACSSTRRAATRSSWRNTATRDARCLSGGSAASTPASCTTPGRCARRSPALGASRSPQLRGCRTNAYRGSAGRQGLCTGVHCGQGLCIAARGPGRWADPVHDKPMLAALSPPLARTIISASVGMSVPEASAGQGSTAHSLSSISSHPFSLAGCSPCGAGTMLPPEVTPAMRHTASLRSRASTAVAGCRGLCQS